MFTEKKYDVSSTVSKSEDSYYEAYGRTQRFVMKSFVRLNKNRIYISMSLFS